ncbi:GTPase [Vibrio sp. SCSIO 43136]|uniref:GTPase family protein n=1 Tax=Vibrio sp. SCSIO 43136 TaxID=2819101 RepID=UPI002075EFE8|nr:GTPase [Vibrio sp. SCSIO 43136]USD66415.1 50S ribosome-binding GTPase [Vibrio sp. SCSIO 43136]
MSRLKHGAKSINHFAGGMVAFSLVGLLLPLIVLSGFGLYAVVTHGYAVHFAIFLLASSLMVMIPRGLWLRSQRKNRVPEETNEEVFVEASSDWSETELELWSQANTSIKNKLDLDNDWSALKKHGLEIAAEMSQAYGKKELDFTLPEGLQLLEEISRRYRKILHTHVPGIDLVKVSQLKWVYDKNDKYGEQAGNAIKYGMHVWRFARAANPAAAVASELRSQLFGALKDKASKNLQHNIKRAFLQEIAKLSLELYSGRFTIESSDIQTSKATLADKARKAIPLEPVRITVVGQMNAGKSSLVNALLKEVNAEVDALPATDDIRSYQCHFDGEEQLNIIDMPGLDGNLKMTQSMLEQITHSDLVLWVLKANQSARQLDVELREQIDAYYQEKKHQSHKRAKVIGVLNHIDGLKPSNEWAPPYDLTDQAQPKVKTINAAMEYNQSLLSFASIYPLALPSDKPQFGLDALEQEIQEQCDHAKAVQLNRRRNEHKGAAGIKQQSQRLFKGAAEIVKNAVKSN